jgi:hypothetical protein
MNVALTVLLLAVPPSAAEAPSCHASAPGAPSVCDGIVATDADGRATIALPQGWSARHDRYRYQLTVLGDSWARARVVRPIEDGRFQVETDAPETRVSWQVTALSAGVAPAASADGPASSGAASPAPPTAADGAAIEATGAWDVAGNAGVTPGNFLGTTDWAPLELRVANTHGFRIEPQAIPNVIGGHAANAATGVLAAHVGGGGWSGGPNVVGDDYGTVGGGYNNRAGDPASTMPYRFGATVGGGGSNAAFGTVSTIGGGSGNAASAELSTVGGGGSNQASGFAATIGGGQLNVAGGAYATVAGGMSNRAGGERSFAAGYAARVRDASESGDANGDEGTFAWADNLGAWFTSTGPNQFLVRASGGVGIGTNAPVAGNGNLTVAGTLSFGAQTRQMIHLWGPGTYGIGIQPSRQYFRADNGASFAWYVGGSHTDAGGPGPGGVQLMQLDSAGNLRVRGSVISNVPLKTAGGTVVLDRTGAAEVALPEALPGALAYQLTAIGAAAPGLHVAREAADGRFAIAGGVPGQRVSWHVSAE